MTAAQWCQVDADIVPLLVVFVPVLPALDRMRNAVPLVCNRSKWLFADPLPSTITVWTPVVLSRRAHAPNVIGGDASGIVDV
jgi:hypothetical protein